MLVRGADHFFRRPSARPTFLTSDFPTAACNIPRRHRMDPTGSPRERLASRSTSFPQAFLPSLPQLSQAHWNTLHSI